MADSNGKKALKSGVWYTAANFFTRGIGFITMPLFTRLMSASEIGNYSNFTSWLSILTSVITLDLYTSVTLAKFDYKDKIKEYISSVLMLGSLVTMGFFLFSLPFKQQILKLGLNELEYYLLFLIPLVSPSLQMLQIKNRLEFKYKFSVALSLGSTMLATVAGVVCVMSFEDKLTGRLIGHNVPLIITYVVIYAYFIIHSPHMNTQYWKYAIKISAPLVIHVLSAHLLSSSDRIMITSMIGSEYNALYSVAYSCSMVVSMLWMSMNTAWSPWAYEQMNHENYPALKKASRPYLLFFGFVVFCFMLIAPDLLLLMGGEAYAPAKTVIPPILVAFVFQFVYSLYVNIETYSKKQKYIAISTSIAAVVNIVLNLVFIPVYGYAAAAFTTLAGYMALYIIHFLFVRKLGKTEWYDTKFNMAFLVFFLFIMGVCYLLYQNSYVRYAIISILFVVGIIATVLFRKEIIYLVKNRSTSLLKLRLKSIQGKVTEHKK